MFIQFWQYMCVPFQAIIEIADWLLKPRFSFSKPFRHEMSFNNGTPTGTSVMISQICDGLVPEGNEPLSEPMLTYRKTSSISRTKPQSLNVSCILLQLSSLNPLKPGVRLITQM